MKKVKNTNNFTPVSNYFSQADMKLNTHTNICLFTT